MAQRSIPREISRQAAANNRIANEPEEGSLAVRAHITGDQGERGLWLQDRKETESYRNDSQSSSAVPPHQLGTGRVNLAWIESHHIDSAEATSSAGKENPALCGDLNTPQEVTLEIHPIPKTMTVRRETTKL